MPVITVYRFRYFDRDSKSFRMAEDHATADAIREMGAILVPGSATVVDRALVSRRGLVVRPKTAAVQCEAVRAG